MGKDKKTTKKHSKSPAKHEDVEMKAEGDDTRQVIEKKEREHDKKNRAQVKKQGIDNAATYEHPASFAAETGQLDPSSLKHFAQHADISIKKLTKEECVFDLIGAEPPLANALRRIMIAEIPTVAIEKVTVWQNTSIIPDENLAHRMGLVPLDADARQFEYPAASAGHSIDDYDENTALKFKLHKVCTKKDKSAPMILNETHDDEKLYNNANVYSGDLVWQPMGNQAERLGQIKPLHHDILLAKLRPGQEIEMEFVCTKGIGKTHAKWSPVCTAYYRLLPDIRFDEPVTGQDAHDLKKLCPMGVFDIEDLGKNMVQATVANQRNCTTCRECIRHDRFTEKINLGKKKDVFEFHVESVGMYKPEDIVLQSIGILKEKVNQWMEILSEQAEHEDSSPQKDK